MRVSFSCAYAYAYFTRQVLRLSHNREPDTLCIDPVFCGSNNL